MPRLASDSDAKPFTITDAYIDHLADGHAYGKPCPNCRAYFDAVPDIDADTFALIYGDAYPIADTAPDSAAERY